MTALPSAVDLIADLILTRCILTHLIAAEAQIIEAHAPVVIRIQLEAAFTEVGAEGYMKALMLLRLNQITEFIAHIFADADLTCIAFLIDDGHTEGIVTIDADTGTSTLSSPVDNIACRIIGITAHFLDDIFPIA